MQARGEATWVGEGARHGVRARQRTSRHPVATVNVFLQLVRGRKGIEFGRGGGKGGGRWRRKVLR